MPNHSEIEIYEAQGVEDERARREGRKPVLVADMDDVMRIRPTELELQAFRSSHEDWRKREKFKASSLPLAIIAGVSTERSILLGTFAEQVRNGLVKPDKAWVSNLIDFMGTMIDEKRAMSAVVERLQNDRRHRKNKEVAIIKLAQIDHYRITDDGEVEPDEHL